MEFRTKKHLKILVIGRSGSGKTTLINCMVNHFFNKRYNEKRHIAITQHLTVKNVVTEQVVPLKLPCNMPNFERKQSEAAGSQSQSQTSKPNIYDLEYTQMKLSIVDTPGLGDTGGLEVDRSHSEKICQAAAALTDFNAIIFVHKAGDCRKDVMLSYMIREFQGILPKDCKDNFIVCFTGAPNPKKIDALPALKEMHIPVTKYFTFENDYLIPKAMWLESTGVGNSPSLLSKYHSTIRKMEDYWEDARDTFGELMQYIGSLIPQPGKSLLELSLKRQIIRKLISDNSDKFSEVQMRMARLEDRQKELATLRQSLVDNKDYETKHVTLVKKIRYIPVSRMEEKNVSPAKITQCLLCKYLCHDPCHLDQVYAKGDINLNNCYAMAGTDTCKRQQCLHSREDHWHTHLKTVEVVDQVPEEYLDQETVSELDPVKHAHFTHASQQMPAIDALVQQLEQEVAAAHTDLDSIYRQVAYLHRQLDQQSQHVRNEFFVEYLAYKRTALFSGKVSEADKQRELEFLRQAEADYNSLKHVVESAEQWVLGQHEQAVLRSQFQVLMGNLDDTIRSYQGDRAVYCQLEDAEFVVPPS